MNLEAAATEAGGAALSEALESAGGSDLSSLLNELALCLLLV